MNFAEFRILREKMKREQPDLIDMAETNHVCALGPLLPQVEVPEGAPRAHRCHLAEDWLALFGLPEGMKSRLSVSRGVRHSLSLLLPIMAREGYRLHLPEDVYPVYKVLASAAGIAVESFPTLPVPEFPPTAVEGVKGARQAEALLLPNPLKPLGRYLLGEEVENLKVWLREDERRRLIVDAVYTFDTQLHPTTLDLLATGQTIVLHSLSKGWAAPLVLGVALFPESDADVFRPSFRDDSPTQPELQLGQLLVHQHSRLPHLLREALESKQNIAKEVMRSKGFPLNFSGCPGYLSTLALPWEELHQRHSILGIPASAFGSSRSHLTILSTLAMDTSAAA